MSKNYRIAVVEDDPFVSLEIEIETALEDAHYEIASTSSTQLEGIEEATNSSADLFTLDYDLNGETTFKIAEMLNKRKIPFIVISGQVKLVRKLLPFKDTVCFEKPFQAADIIPQIRKLLLQPKLKTAL